MSLNKNSPDAEDIFIVLYPNILPKMPCSTLQCWICAFKTKATKNAIF